MSKNGHDKDRDFFLFCKRFALFASLASRHFANATAPASQRQHENSALRTSFSNCRKVKITAPGRDYFCFFLKGGTPPLRRDEVPPCNPLLPAEVIHMLLVITRGAGEAKDNALGAHVHTHEARARTCA